MIKNRRRRSSDEKVFQYTKVAEKMLKEIPVSFYSEFQPTGKKGKISKKDAEIILNDWELQQSQIDVSEEEE